MAIRPYAAFMRAYAAYKPPMKHRISFYLQKNTQNICICEKFVVPLHSLSIREIYRGVEQW